MYLESWLFAVTMHWESFAPLLLSSEHKVHSMCRYQEKLEGLSLCGADTLKVRFTIIAAVDDLAATNTGGNACTQWVAEGSVQFQVHFL